MMADLFEESPTVGRKIVATYPYENEGGALLFEVVRYNPKDFRQRRPDGKGGWVWNLEGVRRVLYRLPEVLAAVPEEFILVVEGERDVETARALGLIATTNPGGAGKWKPVYSDFFWGRQVAVIADADAPGLLHAREVARSLVAIAAEVRLIEALPQAKDLSEWVGLGDSDSAPEQLLVLIQETPPLTPADLARWEPSKPGGFTLTPLRDLLSKPNAAVEYIWNEHLVAGTVSAVVSKPKVGKSTFARNLCLAVARGEDFLGLSTTKGECVYLALEEREEDVRNDFHAMGADGSEPILIYAAAAPAEGIRKLCDLVRERKPILVVIDPLFRLARIKDEKAYAETYAALGPLIDVSRETGTHVMAPHHSGKALKVDAIDSPLGSTAIGGAVSTLIVLRRSEAYRTIQTVQRIGHDMSETVLDFDRETRRLSLGGTRFDVDRHDCERRILEFLKDAAEAQTQAQIRDGVEGQTRIIRAALTELFKTGRVARTGAGTKGSPFSYGFQDSGSQYTAGTSKPESES
jgi:hypothetical protein